jgi:hypothetical protein
MTQFRRRFPVDYAAAQKPFRAFLHVIGIRIGYARFRSSLLCTLRLCD